MRETVDHSVLVFRQVVSGAGVSKQSFRKKTTKHANCASDDVRLATNVGSAKKLFWFQIPNISVTVQYFTHTF